MKGSDIMQQGATAVAALVEALAADSGAPINGVKFHRTEGGWLLVVKTTSASRGALVCFYGGQTIEDCFEQLIYDVYHKPGIKWKADKYA